MNSKQIIPVKCPCCGEDVLVELTLSNKDFSINHSDEEIKQALEIHGIELAIERGGENNE